jgi:hypothetical protein
MITATTRDLVARLAGLLSKERTALKAAGELIEQYPEVLEPLRDGRLCITTVHELSRVITPDNRAEVLPRFFGLSRQEAKAVAAEIAPRLEVPRKEVVTTVRAPALVLDLGHEANRLALSQPTPTQQQAARLTRPAPQSTHPTVEPLTADEHRLHLTVSPEFLRMLDACKKALSHSMPGADAAAVLEEGMKLILAKDSKKKALVRKPRPRSAANEPLRNSRYIPAEVRRAVWKRDQGKCQWRVESGEICGSEIRPELDHIHGFKPGEPVTSEDLRILCRFHNDLAARLRHGDELIDECQRRRGRRRSRERGDPVAREPDLSRWPTELSPPPPAAGTRP